MLRDKKGVGLNDLYPAIITIVLIGMVLGIGIFVLDETSRAISSEAFAVSGENVNVTRAGTAVNTAGLCGFSDMAVTAVTNLTGSLIGAGNYSATAGTGTISNATATVTPTSWLINYTYQGSAAGSNYCSSIITASTGIGTFADWIAVIVVVLAAAIVLGIVVGSFGRRKGSV